VTRKHYNMIAACFREQKIECGRKFSRAVECAAAREGIRMAAEAFALEASLDNPRFDRNRFLAACGFQAEG
jgi:hypothetical protein